jgi:hypothetical protein
MRDQQSERRLFSADDFRNWVDDLAREVFGLTAEEFFAEYHAGKFAGIAIATYIASVEPLIYSQ